MKKVLAIIPARSGSKTIINKNIRLMAGKPMMAYSIDHALRSEYINRVIVSTDSEDYRRIALEYGAEAPFLRPKKIAEDSSLDIEVFEHALEFLREMEGYIPDIVVHLRPTYPVRNVKDIDNTIRILLENETIDSVRCITKAENTPYKMWKKEDDGKLIPLLNDITEAYNMPRQQLPVIYIQNACIDVVRTDVIVNKHSMTGENIYGYEMKENVDIDTEEEFIRAEQIIQCKNGTNTYVIDIDGVIAKYNANLNYEQSQPDFEMINLINKIYDMGNEIILFTARGYKTGKDWKEVTEKQMRQWGVKYSKLLFNKPSADFYLDDHNISLGQIKQIWGREE